MLNFFLFCLAVIGMTNIIVDSNLFAPVREYLKKELPPKVYEILECHQCCGTWCGFLCGLILISWNPFVILLCGCAGSCLASAFYMLTEFLLSKTDFDLKSYMDDEDEEPS